MICSPSSIKLQQAQVDSVALPPPPLELKEFVEYQDAFTRAEASKIRDLFEAQPTVSGNNYSFTGIPCTEDSQWVYDRMLKIAVQADDDAGWGLLISGITGVRHTDEIVYDRFGPVFTDPEFKWHVDAGEADPRLVSVVGYLSQEGEFQGGQLQMELQNGCIAQRDYSRGNVVVFRSKKLRHVVTPVTDGERRSFLLLVGNGEGLRCKPTWRYG